MSRLEMVAAVARNGVIGREGGLPWHIPSELRRFKQATLGKPIVMGRRTWEGLPRKPLPGRLNIVLTRQKTYVADGAHVVANKGEAISLGGTAPWIAVIGGAEIYRLFLPEADQLRLTEVDIDADGDARFPEISNADWLEAEREEVPADPVANVPGYRVRLLVRRPLT